MRIEKGTSAAVTVRLNWANLHGVRAFLRQKDDNADRQIRGGDDSHVIFAKVVDADHPVGLWIDIDWRKSSDEMEKRAMLIPWSEIVTVVLGGTEEEARRIGFNS